MADDRRMIPRSLRAISQIPVPQRFGVLAEGLELLAANAATFEHDARALGTAGRHQGAAALRGFADEEAAKVLIIADLARAGWDEHSAVRNCMSSFYSHMGRGLYVRAYGGAPADLKELRTYVDMFRQEYYLDGPMGVDWIFGNEVNSDREERLYVDYVVEEDGAGRWVGPAEKAALLDEPFKTPAPTSMIVELVESMRKVGLLTAKGLTAIRTVWDGIVVSDDMHWSELQPLNLAVLEELAPDGFANTQEIRKALCMIRDHWCFHMTSLDLTLDRVDRDALRHERERQLAQLTDTGRSV
jgi:AbiV family abortive infection protein